jgi:tellurite resistance protein TehA-like permease
MGTEYPTPVEDRTEAIPSAYVIIGVIVLMVLGLVLAAGILFLSSNYPAQIEAVRDVFIIALALESCVFGVVLMLMLIMLIRLVNTVEFEIKPILEQTNETIGTVRGTTNFVSKNVIGPVVKTKSYVAGVRQGFRALFGDPRKNLPD